MFTRRTSFHILQDILSLNMVTKAELATIANLSHRLASDYISFLEERDLMGRKTVGDVTYWHITPKGTAALCRLTETMQLLGIDSLEKSKHQSASCILWGQVKDRMEKGQRKIIDLSVSISSKRDELVPVKIKHIGHHKAATTTARHHGLEITAFPNGKHAASETITLGSHAGTHMDAPLIFGDTSGGKPAKTIDEIPLEWCLSDGVVLDFSKKKWGESISAEDVQEKLRIINYELKPLDIVLIRTDSAKHLDKPGWRNMHPGMSREATLWLIEQGVKVMGIDAFSWDRPLAIMVDEYKKGVKGKLFAAHYVGREKEYCHIEKMVNLDLIPKPYGFKVAVFPVKIEKGSGAWVRAVAIVDS